jgi:uncharacterized protein
MLVRRCERGAESGSRTSKGKRNDPSRSSCRDSFRGPRRDAQVLCRLFGWKVASEGAFPGYTFIDTGVDGSPYVAISPRQADEVLFFVAVDDVASTLNRAQEIGGKIVQPEQKVPGTAFGVLADAQGHKVGVASNG